MHTHTLAIRCEYDILLCLQYTVQIEIRRGRKRKRKNKTLMKQYCTYCVIVREYMFVCVCDSHFDSIFTCFFLRAEWEIRMAEQCALYLNHLFSSSGIQSNTIMYSLYQFSYSLSLSNTKSIYTVDVLYIRVQECVCVCVRELIKSDRDKRPIK